SSADPVVRANAGDKFLVDDGEMLFAERAEDRLVQRKLERRAVRAELLGSAAPELSGKTSPGGQRLGWSELRGKVVLLVFFATWRPTSAEQLPLAEELSERYGEQGLAVVGIHQRIVPGVLEQFVRERKLTFPIVIDKTGSGFHDGVGSISHRYGVGLEGEDVAGSSPTYFLIDRDGKVQRGYAHEPPAPDEIEKLLAAEPR
ncbi:MAG TPA: TlpA disulfide reductase family protein, partial [Thermomicrobiales bacterium]|nr:TlpA disulfide reductase family protein [Thermomicrobiales bacterium]